MAARFSNTRTTAKKPPQDIDDEVKRIITECFDRAKEILAENVKILHLMAEALLDRETLDREEIRMILEGEKLPPVKRKSGKAKAKEAPVVTEEKPDDAQPDFPGNPLPRPDTP